MQYVEQSPAPPGRADSFRALAETTPDGIITGDAEHRVAYVNPAAERLLGYAATDMLGQPVAMIVPPEHRAAHEAGFTRFLATREPQLIGTTVTVDALRADGSLVPIELSLGFVEGDAGPTVTAVIRDISGRVRNQRYMAAQLAVTSALTAPEAPDQHSRVIEALTWTLGWDVGVLWLVENDRLRLAELWQADPAATEPFAVSTREHVFTRGEGAPGLAWETGEPVWLEEARRQDRFPRARAATETGIATGVSLPLVTEGLVVGVIEIYTRQPDQLDEILRDTLLTVSSQIGESLRRQQHAADLARSNAELEEFASIVAHDLSEPLRTVLAWIHRFGRRLPSGVGQRMTS